MKSFKSFRFIVLLLAAMMMLTACSENSPSESVGDLKEHFMVNGCLYWQSAFPSGTMPETFQYAGDIIETVEKTPISDWTSYSLPIGTKVYLDPQKPHQAWIDGKYGIYSGDDADPNDRTKTATYFWYSPIYGAAGFTVKTSS